MSLYEFVWKFLLFFSSFNKKDELGKQEILTILSGLIWKSVGSFAALIFTLFLFFFIFFFNSYLFYTSCHNTVWFLSQNLNLFPSISAFLFSCSVRMHVKKSWISLPALAQVTFPGLLYRMSTYILKICVCWRPSPNILKTLTVGWDSFGFEYKPSIVCWLLVIPDKPCLQDGCLCERFSRQWQHFVYRKHCSQCLGRHSEQRPCPSTGQPNAWARGGLEPGHIQLLAVLVKRENSLKVWGLPIAGCFTLL